MALAYILFLAKYIRNRRNEKGIFVFCVCSEELWCWIKRKTHLLLKDLILLFGGFKDLAQEMGLGSFLWLE